MLNGVNIINKYPREHIIKFLIGILFFVMSFTTCLLIIEYRFFKDQSQKMIELRENYCNYILIVKKVIQNYTKIREQEDSEESIEEEKKNGNDQLAYSPDMSFSNGATIFSEEEDESQDSFMLINRDLDYLKQSTLAYLKEQDLASITKTLDDTEWLDYTDYLLEQNPVQPKKRIPLRAKGQRVVQRQSTTQARKRVHCDMLFSWPIDRSNFWLSSFFGPRRKVDRSRGFHYGIDMAALKGTPVKAAASGIVIEARYLTGYGNTVVIMHNRKYQTRYAHLDIIYVVAGQKVNRGNLIGRVGDTGFVRKSGKDASHLHFEVYSYRKQVNPLYFLT